MPARYLQKVAICYSAFTNNWTANFRLVQAKSA